MRYENILLHLAADGPGTFAIRVLGSPAGEAAVRSRTLPTGEGWERIAVELERQVAGERARRSGHRHLAMASDPTLPPHRLRDLEQIGRDLFEVLFPPPIRDRLRESLGRIGGSPESGLRIRLQMDVEDAQVARLQSLPWEYLFDDGHLALRRATPILRSLDLAGPRRSVELVRPLRILAVLCEPNDLPALRLEDERETLTAIWKAQGEVDVIWLSNPTLDEVCAVLSRSPVHVLHFLGHGELDATRREGQLFFTGPDHRSQPIGASTLAIQLAGATALRLVFLNACQTAAAAAEAPFAGMATALLRTGVPAVIAMQAPIPDGAAIAYAAAIYGRLAAGDTIEEATTEGRLALHRREPHSMVWGIPVVYLRGLDPATERSSLLAATAKPRRRTRSIATALAATLTVVGGAGTAWRWTSSEITSDAKEQPSESAPSGASSVALTDAIPQDDGSLRPPRLQHADPRSEQTAEPPPRKPATPAAVELHDGRPSFLEEVGAHVTADFLQLGSQFVRITISPQGAMPRIQPVMGPGTVEADSPQGILAVDVLTIDWSSRIVTVRGRLATAPVG